MTTQNCQVTLWTPQHGQCSRVQLHDPLRASVLVGASYRSLSLLKLRAKTIMM